MKLGLKLGVSKRGGGVAVAVAQSAEVGSDTRFRCGITGTYLDP